MATQDLHVFLKATYPHLFTKPYKPLAIGIHKELIKRHAEAFSATVIRDYLKGFTRSPKYARYFLDLEPGDARYNLDGHKEGEVNVSDIDHASHLIKSRLGKRWKLTDEELALNEKAKAVHKGISTQRKIEKRNQASNSACA